MLNQFNAYDHQYYDDNVYGSALSILKRNQSSETKSGAIHFDIGCGYGRVAEHITNILGLHYVGVDGDEASLKSLSERGYETHHSMLTDFEGCLALFRKIIGKRRVASITMLDVLEHLPNGDDVLLAIRQIASDHGSVVVVSVPNVAHRDIGFRLAFGEWAYTQEGLLDHTHTRLFNKDFFTGILKYNGLHPIDEQNVNLRWSDQHFPPTHPALASGSLIQQVLAYYRDQVDDTSTVNQFVFGCVAGARIGERPYVKLSKDKRPFLSIIMRTQGTRSHTMVEALTALAAQTDRDFEILVIGHKLSIAKQKIVERTIEDSPAWLREKIRFVRVDVGNRTHPLNVGFRLAQGEYISILDDDDVPFGHWVETFKSLSAKSYGRVLRAVAAKQSILTVSVDARNGIRAVDTPEPYPGEFDLFEHLGMNATPPVSVAFPRGVFEDLNITFDETLTTTEDWDFMMRAILVVGIESSPKITSLYHWWLGTEQSSRTDHDQDEWINNHHTILKKLDNIPIILPPKSAGKITRLLQKSKEIQSAPIYTQPALVYTHPDVLLDVAAVLDSTSWKVSFPLRLVKSLLTRQPILSTRTILGLSEPELANVLRLMYSSWSWKLTAPVRFFSLNRLRK